jgi:anti-sigma factor RsiW
MSRILRFQSSAHRQADRLLPWYVNGTLDAEQSQQVREHVAHCVQCQDELSQLQALQLACSGARVDSDVATSFERLCARIATSEQQPRRGNWLAIARIGWRDAAPWLRWASTVQLFAILVLGVLLFRGQASPATYRTLGDVDVVAATTGAIDRHLVVVFEPELSHARMQALLRASNARVIDGPNEAGAYVLALPAERIATAQEALRAAPGVLMVERLDPANGSR